MEVFGLPPHSALAISAAVLGPVGCLVALWYAGRPDRRDFWRWPMFVSAVLATVSILGAYISGERMLTDQPGLASNAQVLSHQQYATKLVLPTAGYFVVASLSALLNPRTGALRLALPSLLAVLSLVVLVLVVLSADADTRSLWDTIRSSFDFLN